MKTIRLSKTTIGLLAILLAGLYLATVTVEPVFAYNAGPKIYSPKLPTIKAMDSTVSIATKITNEDKDKMDKLDKCKKDKKDDTIKIKSHPILKSLPGNSVISTTSLSTLRPKPWYNVTV